MLQTVRSSRSLRNGQGRLRPSIHSEYRMLSPVSASEELQVALNFIAKDSFGPFGAQILHNYCRYT